MIEENAFDFRWGVRPNGYVILQSAAMVKKGEGLQKSEPHLFVVMKPMALRSLTATNLRKVQDREYSPLEENAGLFLTFANTKMTPDGILGFANRFGMLGGSIGVQLPPEAVEPRDYLETAEGGIYAEDLESWMRQIEWMHTLVGAWLTEHEEGTEELPNGFVNEESKQSLQIAIDVQLVGRSSTRFLWNKERTHRGIYIVPQGLIGALWLQFAQAIDKDKHFRKCKVCDMWWEVQPPVSRTTRTYCSGACRFKAYRNRQAEANRLHKQGFTPSEIAKRLDTDTSVILGWLSLDGQQAPPAQ